MNRINKMLGSRPVHRVVCCIIIVGLCNLGIAAQGHDLWIETSREVVFVGEPIKLDLKLGNCNDGVPDFRINGTLPKQSVEVAFVSPSGKVTDLSDSITNSSFAEEHGYWSTIVRPKEEGLGWAVHRLDQIIDHGMRVRGRLFAKTPIVCGEYAYDPVPVDDKSRGFSQPYEIILDSSPVPSVESEEPISIRIFYNGSPMPNSVVTFLPFGEKLRTPDDERFRLVTDDLGTATYLPTSSGPILISSHYIDASAKGDGYAATYYSATMYLHVRQRDAR